MQVVGDRLVRAPMVSPEEGVRHIRAFIRIKQPQLRAAIIKLVTQIADELLPSNHGTRK